MAETSYLAESALAYPSLFDQLRLLTKRPTETAETLAMSAVAASIEQDAGAIIVLSTSGISARFLSKFRPACPIICGMLPFPPPFGVSYSGWGGADPQSPEASRHPDNYTCREVFTTSTTPSPEVFPRVNGRLTSTTGSDTDSPTP